MRLLIGMFMAICIAALAHAFGSAAKQEDAKDVLEARYTACMAAYEAGDWAAAHDSFLALARAGHAGAEAMMGKIYYLGHGVEKNAAAAAIWLYRAARRGYGAAQLALGTLYREGDGVAADPAQAYAWYALAALRGGEAVQAEAESLMAELSSSLDQTQIADARAWVANWRPAYSFPAAGAASQAAN